jgi:hypothetical protein
MNHHWMLNVLVLSPLLAPLAPPASSGQATAPAEQTQQPSDPLDAQYEQVQRDFNQAMAQWQKALDEARKAGVQRSDWPLPPHPQFWGRYAELARAGHLPASIWCLSAGSNLGEKRAPDASVIDMALARVWKEALAHDQAQLKGELDANSVAARYPVKEYLRLLRSQTMVLGGERTLTLYEQCFEQSVQQPSKALALLSKASFIGTRDSGFADPMPVVMEIYRELVDKYGDTESGQRAKGRLFRYERLQVGMQIPDFESEDVEGVRFKLSDYSGKVIVLDFWGFW